MSFIKVFFKYHLRLFHIFQKGKSIFIKDGHLILCDKFDAGYHILFKRFSTYKSILVLTDFCKIIKQTLFSMPPSASI